MTEPIYKYDIGIFQKLVDINLCENLIRYFEDTQGDGRRIYQNERMDYSKGFKFSDSEDLKNLKLLLVNSLRTYTDKYIGLNQYGLISDLCKIQKTPRYGGFHKWHYEHGLEPGLSGRVLVWMIYLNDLDHRDGTTEFVYQNLEVQPEQGTLLIWPAYFNYLHRGNPPRNKNKYIATGWWHHVNPQNPYNELLFDPKWDDPEDYFAM